MKNVVGTIFLLFAAALSAQPHDDMLPPGHVDGYSGRSVMEVTEDRIVLALDEDGDDVADHVFDFSPRGRLAPERVEGDAVIEFWHDGMSVATDGRVLVLTVVGAGPSVGSPPAARWIDAKRDRESDVSVQRIAGDALMVRSSAGLGPISEPALMVGGRVPTPQPTPDGGGGGSCAKSCSVSCRAYDGTASSCSVTCSAKAECFCDSAGYSICWCSAC